jgi:hypothetical protein
VAFVALITRAAHHLRLTPYAFLCPPKLRTVGRFQSIINYVHWALKVLDLTSLKVPLTSERATLVKVLREAIGGGLGKLRPFLKHFCDTVSKVNEFQTLIKNQGLNAESYHQAKAILLTLPKRSRLRRRLLAWLDRSFRTQTRLKARDYFLPVSSDVLESYFGVVKADCERQPQKAFNQLVLAAPARLGNLTAKSITDALAKTGHTRLKCWSKVNVPPSPLTRRRASFPKVLHKTWGKVPTQKASAAALI